MGCVGSGESLLLMRNIAIDTGSLEYSGGKRNSWCSGEMLGEHEERRLRRQLTRLPLTWMLERVSIKQD